MTESDIFAVAELEAEKATMAHESNAITDELRSKFEMLSARISDISVGEGVQSTADMERRLADTTRRVQTYEAINKSLYEERDRLRDQLDAIRLVRMLAYVAHRNIIELQCKRCNVYHATLASIPCGHRMCTECALVLANPPDGSFLPVLLCPYKQCGEVIVRQTQVRL